MVYNLPGGEGDRIISDKLEPAVEVEEQAMSWETYFLGVGYILAMGVCGLVLVALGSSLDLLAENVGYEATDVGSVFIARGMGAVLGAIVSAKLYKIFKGNHVMSVALTLISFLLFSLPFNKSYNWLHIYFFFLGLGTSITDTGCQIMTRKLHGKKAGPWLGANTVSFGISGALVPLVEIFTESLTVQYYVISAVVLGVTFMIAFGPNPENITAYDVGQHMPKEHMEKSQKVDELSMGRMKSPHYNVEILISIMVFFLIGGKVTATAYLDSYIDETGVISQSKEPLLVLVLWIAITIGRLAGVQDQLFLTNKTLPIHLSILLLGGFLSMLLVVWFPNNEEALWVGVAFYGLFNGPCVGYCYDLNNRITLPTEKSMSIVMFGLNFGASLVPYITSITWNNGGGPVTLIVVVFLSMLLPLPLLHLTKYVSYDPSVNPFLKNQYEEVPAVDVVEAGDII